MKKYCSVKKCKKAIYNKKQRLCTAHYQRFLRLGDVMADKPLQKKSLKKEYPIWNAFL